MLTCSCKEGTQKYLHMVFNNTKPEYKDWDTIFEEEDLQAEIVVRKNISTMDQGVTPLRSK